MGHFSPPRAERVDVPAGLNSQKICSHTIEFPNMMGNSIYRLYGKAGILGRTKSLPDFRPQRPLNALKAK